MTVPKSERTEAQSEFVFSSMRLQSNINSLARRLPKRWRDDANELRDVARHVCMSCVKANSAYTASVPEYDYRLMLLNEAYSEVTYLQLRVTQITRDNPMRMHSELGSDGAMVQVEEPIVTDKRFKKINEQSEELLRLLRGQIKRFRADRIKEIENEELVKLNVKS